MYKKRLRHYDLPGDDATDKDVGPNVIVREAERTEIILEYITYLVIPRSGLQGLGLSDLPSDDRAA